MSQSNNNQGGYNDLNNQLNTNLQNSNNFRQANAQMNNANQSLGFRGFSRSSNTRGATQAHATQNAHPGTSNSQKRQNNVPTTNSQNPNNGSLNLNIIQRRQGITQSKNLEYLPITTTSYTTTGKGQANAQEQLKMLNNNSEFKLALQNKEQQQANAASIVQQGYSSLMTNTSGNGPISSIQSVHAQAATNCKTVPTDNMITPITNSNQRTNGNGTMETSSSKHQLNGIAQSKSILQLQQSANIKQSIEQSANNHNIQNTNNKQLTTADVMNCVNFNNNVCSEITSPKPLINNSNIKLVKNSEQKLPSSSMQQDSTTISNNLVNQISNVSQNNTTLPQTQNQINNSNSTKTGHGDNIRKLSLAAKSGQMQLQNNPQENHHMTYQQYNSSNNLTSNQNIINEANGYNMINGNGVTVGTTNNQINNAAKPSSKSFALNGAQNLIIPPPSNLGMHTRDSYFQRRQLLQNQRDKKHDLLKHLDHNNRILSQNVVSRYPHQNGLESQSIHLSNNHQAAAAAHLQQLNNGLQLYTEQQPRELGIGMSGSGSQYQLLNTAAALQAYNSTGGQAPQVNANFNPTLRNNQKVLNKDHQTTNTNGTHSSLGNHNTNTSPPAVHHRPVVSQVEGNNPHSNGTENIFNQKRRINALSYMSDAAKNAASSTINVKQQNTKYRASELQNHQHVQGLVSVGYEMKQNGMVGISGKQIALTTTQNGNNQIQQQQQTNMVQAQQPLLQSSQFASTGAHNNTLGQNGLTHLTNADLCVQQHMVNNNLTPNALAQLLQKGGGETVTSSELNPNHSSNNQQQSLYNNINCKITRKLEGGRPHKVYDYMFIQMSNEQFKSEYEQKKIFIQKSQNQLDNEQENERRKLQMQSPNKYRIGIGATEQNNLDGLVKIKAYDNLVTDELPLMQCNLLPTQLDHVKLLICEQEDKNYIKLTPEAATRFEIEKQNQIKQYMEDIIIKLQQKDRKFKVTVKKKFIEDALYNSTSIRVASVYVIVVNREKAYDPLTNKQFIQKHKKLMSDMKQVHDETSEEEEEFTNKTEHPGIRDNLRRSANPHLINVKKTSLYESDNNNNNILEGFTANNESNKAMPNFKQFIQEKSQDDRTNFKNRIKPMSTGPSSFKNKIKQEEQQNYRYVTPVKEYPSKYLKTKIKICQDITAHDHNKKFPVNVYSNQFNEFVRLIFKNSKQNPAFKFSTSYAMGLAKVLGLNLKKDTFSEQNMKSREHICQLKEKLIYCFWRKIHDENKEVFAPGEKQSQLQKTINDSSENELDGGNSIDSTIASSNTPRSKNLGINLKLESEAGEGGQSNGTTNTNNNVASQKVANSTKQQTSSNQIDGSQWALPHPNVIYKYIIGKGNNSMMVRSLQKNRYWWVQGDESDNKIINFMWTQNKVQKIFENMACKYPNKKSGNKHNEFAQLHTTPQQKRSVKKKKLLSSENQKGKEIVPVQLGIKNSETKLYNKIEDNFHINNKKALFLNMKNYYEAIDQDVFDNLPLTFHIKSGFDDLEFKRFEQFYKKFEEDVKNKKTKRKEFQRIEKTESNDQNIVTSPASPNKTEEQFGGQYNTSNTQVDRIQKEPNYYKTQQPQKNIWIIKPGENTNRGQGIQVARELDEIKEIIADSTRNTRRTCILQKYIHNPLLINRRKFDIRTFALFTSWNGNLKAYIYEEGYLRTSCREYSINNLSNKLVHLTNDAVQKMSQDYGKFEPGNKLSFNEFQSFLDKNYPDLHICFERDILPQMNKMTVDVFRASHGKLDPKRRLHCMEIFGLDFMIDDEFRPYLIEVNTNPCLELSCPLLARLIPNMVENAFKIGMDPIFLAPEGFTSKKAFIGDPCPENRFTQVYDERVDGPVLDKLFQTKHDIIVEMNEEFSDDEDVHDEADEDE